MGRQSHCPPNPKTFGNVLPPKGLRLAAACQKNRFFDLDEKKKLKNS
jgi:hypothetical protein